MLHSSLGRFLIHPFPRDGSYTVSVFTIRGTRIVDFQWRGIADGKVGCKKGCGFLLMLYLYIFHVVIVNIFMIFTVNILVVDCRRRS